MLNGFGLIMNKKILPVVLLLLCWLLPAEMAQAKEIRIFVDNVPAFSEVSPYYNQDTLLVPARLISEELGASVDWDGSHVHITGQDVDIVLSLGQNQAIVNGEAQTLAVAPQMKQGTVFVPLRFIAEALSADVLYRDGKIFLYTPLYDDSRAVSGIFERGNKIYKFQENKIYCADEGSDDAEVLIAKPTVFGLAAVSRSGLLFSSNDGGKYYSFKDGSIVDYNIGWNDLYFSTPFTNIGKFFYVELAQSLESFSTKNGVTVPIGEKESYWGIFSSDIDDTNLKTVFIEEKNYGIARPTYFDGWIYYQRRVPVAQDWGYDTYSGPVCRVPAEGGQWQELTPERVGGWFVDADGLHYRTQNDEVVLLPFANMQDININ